jgi:hypothetical protein
MASLSDERRGTCQTTHSKSTRNLMIRVVGRLLLAHSDFVRTFLVVPVPAPDRPTLRPISSKSVDNVRHNAR